VGEKAPPHPPTQAIPPTAGRQLVRNNGGTREPLEI